MDSRVVLVSREITNVSKKLDDIEWANPQDPRIEALVRELTYLKEQAAKGVLYEPCF